jgi:hypothetical protein
MGVLSLRRATDRAEKGGRMTVFELKDALDAMHPDMEVLVDGKPVEEVFVDESEGPVKITSVPPEND